MHRIGGKELKIKFKVEETRHFVAKSDSKVKNFPKLSLRNGKRG